MSSIRRELERATRSSLRLPRRLRDEIEARALAGHPFETCGLLIGRRSGARTEVLHSSHAENVERERPHERYTVDPIAQLAAEWRARDLGLEVVGVWHSHPDRPARFSETDREAAYEGYSYLVLSVSASGVQDARSFRRIGAVFEEEALES